MSTMLVVGSARCVFDDVAAALKLRPFASLMLINGACQLIGNAEHVLAGHEEKSEEFAAARRKKFPNAPPWKLHSCCMPHRIAEYKSQYPSVTDWHSHECGLAAGSAGKGVKLSRILGFTEAILCGCPMSGGGYAEGESDGIKQSMNCLRLGDDGLARGYPKPGTGGREWMLVQDTKMIQGYRRHLAELARGEFKTGVYSMSGFTNQCLGFPPEVF